MRPRHAVVAVALLALIGVAFFWQRTRAGRSGAVRPEAIEREAPASTPARLEFPVDRSDPIREAPLAAPSAEAARVSQTEEVRWVHVEVTGTIVDERGKPVSNALVMLLARPPGGKRGDDERALAQTSTPASGAFELQASMPAREFLVWASHPDHESARSPVLATGANRISLVLPALTGAIAGQLLLDPRVDPLELLVVQHYERPEPPPERLDINVGQSPGFANGWSILGDNRAKVKPDGTFRFDRIQEGSSILCVTAPTMLVEIARIEHVQVRRNETTHDPRLEPLDLRGSLHRFDLHVVDGSGQPVRAGRADVLADREPALVSRNQIQDGYVHILTALTCVDVELSAPQFHDQTVKCVSGDREVVLGEGLTVKVMLDNLPVHGPDLELVVELVSRDTSMTCGTTLVHSDGTVEFKVGAPSWYGIRAYVDPKVPTPELADPLAPKRIPLTGKVIELFHVQDLPGEQFFRVALPRAADHDTSEDEYR